MSSYLFLVKLFKFFLREVLRNIKEKEEFSSLPEITFNLELASHLTQDLIADSETQSYTSWIDFFIVVAYFPKNFKQFHFIFLFDA